MNALPVKILSKNKCLSRALMAPIIGWSIRLKLTCQMSGPLKNLKSGEIELKGSDRKIQILVHLGNQFAKFTKEPRNELQSSM